MSHALLFFCLTGTLPATILNYTGTGSDLNVATFDNSGNVVVGVTTLTIPVTDLYIVDVGDSVTVSLNGLQYPFAGDLQVTLSLEDSLNHVLMSGDVFNRIGLTDPNDPNDVGYDTQFGNSVSINTGNYSFDSRFKMPGTNDLWATAAPLGSSDSIPDGNYWPAAALSPDNDNLSFRFGGMPTNGIWALTIYDYFPPDPNACPPPATACVPGITSWGLTIQAESAGSIPEPSTAILIALSLGLLCLIRRGGGPALLSRARKPAVL